MPGPGPSQQEACCVLKICCGAEAQRNALALRLAEMGKDWEVGALGGDVYVHLASEILANFDLVPKGAGQGIVDAYRPYFKHQP